MQLDFIWSHVSLPGLGKPHHTNISPLSSGYVPGSRGDQPHTGRGEVAEGCHLHPGRARQRDSSWYMEITAVFVLLEETPTPRLYTEVICPRLQSLTLLPSLTAGRVSTSTKSPHVSSITRAPGPIGESCAVTVLWHRGRHRDPEGGTPCQS